MKNYKQFLKERSIQNIKLFDDWVDIEDPEPDNVAELFKILYELEFKYSMLKNYSFNGSPKRKENILNIIEQKADEVFDQVSEMFDTVFTSWMNYHLPENLGKWIEGLENDEIYFDSQDEIESFVRVHHKIFEDDPTYEKMVENFLKSDYITVREYVSQEINDYIQNNDLEYSVDDFFSNEKLWNEFFAEQSDEILFRYPILFDEALEEIYFPLWKKNFKSSLTGMGISEEDFDSTAQNVKKGLSLIDQLYSSDVGIGKKFSILNQIKNINHNTGSMMQYFSDKFYIDEDDFTELSSMDTTEWEQELRELGVELPVRKEFKIYFKSALTENKQLITEDKIGKAISLYKDIINIKNKMTNINQGLANSIFKKLDDILEHYKGNIENKNWDRIIVKDFILMMSDRIKKIIGNLKSNLTNKAKKFKDEQIKLIKEFIRYLERLVQEINNFYKIATT